VRLRFCHERRAILPTWLRNHNWAGVFRLPADVVQTTLKLMRGDPSEIDRRIEPEVSAGGDDVAAQRSDQGLRFLPQRPDPRAAERQLDIK